MTESTMHPRHLAALSAALGEELDPRIAQRVASAYASRSSYAKRKAKLGKPLPVLKRNQKRHDRTATAIQKLATRVFAKQRKALAKALRARAEKYAKADDTDLRALIAEILKDGWDDDAREKLWTLLSDLSEARAAEALEQLKPYLDDEAYAAALTQANERAVEWARFRTTNMITEVDDTTRQIVNELTASTIEDGLTNDQFADLLSDSFGFSDSRSEMIARTETAFADTAGTLGGYKASGVVDKKGWSADAEACDDCAALDGVEVAIDDDFPDGGGDGPPRHPRCECSVYAVLSEDAANLIVDE